MQEPTHAQGTAERQAPSSCRPPPGPAPHGGTPRNNRYTKRSGGDQVEPLDPLLKKDTAHASQTGHPETGRASSAQKPPWRRRHTFPTTSHGEPFSSFHPPKKAYPYAPPCRRSARSLDSHFAEGCPLLPCPRSPRLAESPPSQVPVPRGKPAKRYPQSPLALPPPTAPNKRVRLLGRLALAPAGGCPAAPAAKPAAAPAKK